MSLTPNRKRYNELRTLRDQLRLDLEEARQDDAPGAGLMLHDLKQELREVQHAMFMTGAVEDTEH